MYRCPYQSPKYAHMNQNTRERGPKNGRPAAAAAKLSTRPVVIKCDTDSQSADSEDPLGPQPSLVSQSNLEESPPGDNTGSPPGESIGSSARDGAEAPPGYCPENSDEDSCVDAPRKFKSYDLLWEHSKDALSTTYAVRNGAVDKILTLRLFNARVSDSLQIREIQKAAQKASELTHLHLATVYENGIDETGAPYVVSDLVEGSSLAEVLQLKKRLDIARFLSIFSQVGEALIEAHSHELFHGNLSPDKIVLTPNEVETDMAKLIDFGMPPDPMRNAFYLSPEQCIDRNKSDARSDIYSLGCIMYEALVGSPPFVGSKASQVALNYLHELANQFPKESPEHNALKLLDCIIIKCLQKSPAKRFRNVREFMNALSLVNDCICNGSTKKLPPKAEKLLIFRFLDLFGNKIAAGMTAYLILGFVCMRVIGEVNLQKHLDQASMSVGFNDLRAKDSWKAAISQAENLQKPPSFMAALHNELGNTYNSISARRELSYKNENARKAIDEYIKAYEYYKHGDFFKSDQLNLLRSIAAMWTSLETPGLAEKIRVDAYDRIQKLWAAKQFEECARLAEDYYQYDHDQRVAFYAANANTEIAIKLPTQKALRYFERAAYYFPLCAPHMNFECNNLDICIARLGMIPESMATRTALGYAALEAGDFQAAYSEFEKVPTAEGNRVTEMIRTYLDWKIVYGGTRTMDPALKPAIEPLEKVLSLEEKIDGRNSDSLLSTMSQLATTYARCGEIKKAVAMYERLNKLEPHCLNYQLEYVNMLVRDGRTPEARKFLENETRLRALYDYSDPLTGYLLKLYADTHMKQKIHDALIHMIKYSEPERPYSGITGYTSTAYQAREPYSRNGIIFRE